jgi:hypothetical protein
MALTPFDHIKEYVSNTINGKGSIFATYNGGSTMLDVNWNGKVIGNYNVIRDEDQTFKYVGDIDFGEYGNAYGLPTTISITVRVHANSHDYIMMNGYKVSKYNLRENPNNINSNIFCSSEFDNGAWYRFGRSNAAISSQGQIYDITPYPNTNFDPV